jgi:hypothetical protein
MLGFGALTILVAIGNKPAAVAPAANKTLDVTLTWSDIALEITNVSAPAGHEAIVYLNGTPPSGYRADVKLPEPGKKARFALREFTTKAGDRFPLSAKAVTIAWIGGNGYDFRSFVRR